MNTGTARQRVPFQVVVTESAGVHRVTIHGRLTIDFSPHLLDEFKRVMKEARNVEVDMKAVDFVDSSGISVLIQGLKLAQEKSADFALVDPSPKVRAVLELSQLTEFFTVKSS